jgi:hypothetical protein
MIGTGMYRIERRDFIKRAVGAVAASLAPIQLVKAIPPFKEDTGSASTGIAAVFLDLHRIHKWDASNGDTWDPFWADDDSLYAFNCDGRGFGQSGMNLAFNKLAGDSPEAIVGSQVNSMAEYGKGGQKEADNATWKACGQECIDGIFYAFVSRNTYGSDSHDSLTRQLAANASLIKSMDRGRTWTRTARENYDKPMWPGKKFGAPFFVHYGRNGGRMHKDASMEYVYACSTNGFWNDGDSLILGRVQRTFLSQLNSADWEYLTGPDGSTPKNWSREITQAVPILDRPAKCGQTPITFVPELGVYLLVSWYNTETMTKWYEPNEMRYDFFQAPHLWGPWTQVGSHTDRFLGPNYHMYGPSICSRFQKRHEGDVEVSLFTSGCPFDDVASSAYKMWHIPLVLNSRSLSSYRTVNASDSEIQYKGAWFPWTTSEYSSLGNLPRATQSKGDWAEFSFVGTGIEYLAEKSMGLGEVEIYFDGEHEGSTSLLLEDFPVFLGITVFSKHHLSPSKHVIRIVNAGDARINVEGFKVFA